MLSMQPDRGLVWKFKKIATVNIELFQKFYVKNIPVKLLQHNEANSEELPCLHGSLSTESSKRLH